MVTVIKSIKISYDDYFIINGMLKQFGFYKIYGGWYKLHEVIAFDYYNEPFRVINGILLEVDAIWFSKQGMPIYRLVRHHAVTKTEAYRRFKEDHFITNYYNN